MDQPKVDRMLRLMQMLSSNVNYSVDDLIASFYEDFYETAPGDGLRKNKADVSALGPSEMLQRKCKSLAKSCIFSSRKRL